MINRLHVLFYVSACSLLLTTAAMAQCGYLNPDFGTNGIVVTSIGTNDNEAHAVAVQADGKIVAGGISKVSIAQGFTLIRYNTNGQPDSTFDHDGIVTCGFGNSYSNLTSLCIQPDGKIVAAGVNYYNSSQLTILRYNSNGSLDSAFDADGIFLDPSGQQFQAQTISIALQPDGKIIAAGMAVYNQQISNSVLRLNADGSFDATFGGTGNVLTTHPNVDIYAQAITRLANAKIVVTGSCYENSSFAIATICYNSNGTLDQNFGSGGIKLTKTFTIQGHISGVGERPDGKLVVAVSLANGNHYYMALYGFNADGSTDENFGTNGITTTRYGSGDTESRALLMRPDHKMVVAGYSTVNNHRVFLVASYLPDGTPDVLFNEDGIVTTPVDNKDVEFYAVNSGPDGSIVAAGLFEENGNADFAVAKYIGCIASPVFTTLTVYPNPGTSLPVLLTDNILENATITVYNSIGEQVMEVTGVSGQQYVLHAELLAAGTYYIRLAADGALLGGGKFIKITD